MKQSMQNNGEVFSDDKICVFFGNRFSPPLIGSEVLHFGHQVHDADLVPMPLHKPTSSHLIESSDGTYTESRNLKLALYTADCVPCFVKSTSTLYSLHLGWRSLQKGLFSKAIEQIASHEKVQIFIGPHIRFTSFEVGPEVVEAFHSSLSQAHQKDWFKQKENGKFLISLQKIIEMQAVNFESQVYQSEIDTFTDSDYFSYRREQGTPGRNISFAFLK